MRKNIIVAAAFAVLVFSTAGASGQCKNRSVTKFANEIGDRFGAKTMAELDGQKAIRGQLKMTIEHSLADDDDPQRFEVRRFPSLAKFEQWLKSREIDDRPGRYSREMTCTRGVCRANMDGGINHNSLYLKQITYGMSNGCPYLKTIYILDGD